MKIYQLKCLKLLQKNHTIHSHSTVDSMEPVMYDALVSVCHHAARPAHRRLRALSKLPPATWRSLSSYNIPPGSMPSNSFSPSPFRARAMRIDFFFASWFLTFSASFFFGLPFIFPPSLPLFGPLFSFFFFFDNNHSTGFAKVCF